MKKIKCLSALFALSTATAVVPAITSCSAANSDKNSSNNSATLNKSGVCKVTFLSTDKDVKFEGNTIAEIKSGRKFGSIDKPTATKSGYKFNYWAYSDNGAEVKETDKIEQSTTVTPVFSQEQVTVTINKMDGSQSTTEKVNIGDSITLPAVTRSGYEFKNWVDQDGKTYAAQATITIQKDMSFSVLWEGEQKITVTLSSGNGKFSNDTTIISHPTKSGATIKSILGDLQLIAEDGTEDYMGEWTDGSSTFQETDQLTGDVILTAKYDIKYAPALEAYPSAVGIRIANDHTQVTMSKTGSPSSSLYYSQDGVTWTSWSSGSFYANKGNLYLKGSNSSGLSTGSSAYLNIKISSPFNLSGSIMGLLDGGLGTITEIPCTYCFWYLFYENDTIKNISENFLPSTSLKSDCYGYMFSKCTSLKSLPKLPATTITDWSYYSMFSNCKSLTSIPENLFPENTSSVGSYGCDAMFYRCSKLNSLPKGLFKGATLNSNACSMMFEECTSITKLPQGTLEATTLGSSCYNRMFQSCVNLTTIEEGALPATTLASSCYENMFAYCTSLNNVPTLCATTLASCCYRYMFQGCTGLTDLSKLTFKASELESSCCSYMFSDCTNLIYPPILSSTSLSSSCYYRMFSGCSNLASAPDLPATTIPSGAYKEMFYECVSLVSAPALPATTFSDTYCYYQMFYGCTSLTSAPDLPCKTLTEYCYYGMFSGCTSLVTAPEISATTLASYCCQTMFENCSSLQSGPSCLNATSAAAHCYNNMFHNCTALITPPQIKLTSLAKYCCVYMFHNCSSLLINNKGETGTTSFFYCPTFTEKLYPGNGMFTGCGGTYQSDYIYANNTYYYG